jgi:hypothetical protein
MRHTCRSRKFTAHASARLPKAAGEAARGARRKPRPRRRLHLETLESRQLLTVMVADFGLSHDTGPSATDGRTTDPTLQGRVRPALSDSPTLSQILVQFDHDGDGQAEATVSTGDGDRFTYTPRNLTLGLQSIAARALQWDADSRGYLTGAWSVASFHLEAAAAGELIELRLEEPDALGGPGGVASGLLLAGRLVGSVEQVANQEVQLDLRGDPQVDATTVTDAEGNFAYRLLTPGTGAITVRARATRYEPRSSSLVTGDWVELSADLRSMLEPKIEQLQPAAGVRDDQGHWTSDSAAVRGRLLSVVPGRDAFIQWDYNDDGQPDADSSVDADGQFLHRAPSISPGTVTLAARGMVWDDRLAVFTPGPWTSLQFALAATPELELLAPVLTLRNDTGSSANDLQTTDPTVAGTLGHGTGSQGTGGQGTGGQGTAGAFLTVELDFDGDGQLDDTTTSDAEGHFQFWPIVYEPGEVTVRARTRQWDASRQEGRLGPWSSLTFTLLPLQSAPPRVDRLELASDSGDSQHDNVTANGLLRGSVADAPQGTRVVVQFDHDSDQVVDGQVLVGHDGSFYYEPPSLDAGPQTIQARAVGWDPFQQTDIAGPWNELSFVIESQPSVPAIIDQLRVVSGDEAYSTAARTGVSKSGFGDSTTSVIQGQIINENSLADVVVELDVDNDGVPDQFAVTDALGRFQIQPLGLEAGIRQLRMRTREISGDRGQWTYGGWVSLSYENASSERTAVEVAWLGLARDTGAVDDDGWTWDSSIRGRLEQVDGLDADRNGTLTVQLDVDADGVVDATVTPDSQGWFTYEPSAWQPGPKTIQARTRFAPRLQADAPQPPVHSSWASLQFVLESPPLSATSIERIELAHDTGLSAEDGSTDDPTLQGQVRGTELATSIGFDLNGDGQVDAWTDTDSDGRFTFRPDGLDPGLVTLRAKVAWPDEAGGAGDFPSDSWDLAGGVDSTWYTLTFVYSSAPDSAPAQALVAGRNRHAAALIEARRQWDDTRQAGELAHNAARQEALAAHDERLEDAVSDRQRAIATAELAYRSARQASEAAYVQAVAEAGRKLLDATSASPGEGAEELAELDARSFSWPAAPQTALATPLGDVDSPWQSQPWFADRPDYPLEHDQTHIRQVAAATETFDQAVRAMEVRLLEQREQAAQQYQQAAGAAQRQYLHDVRAAQQDYAQTLDAAVSPIDVADVDRQYQLRRSQAEQILQDSQRSHRADYEAAIRAAADVETAEIQAAVNAYEQTRAAAGQRYLPEIGDPSATPEQREQSRHAYISILAENEITKATAIADANQRFKETMADEGQRMADRDAQVQLQFEQDLLEAQRVRSEQMAANRQWTRVIELSAKQQLRLAVGEADKERALRLNAAQQQYVETLATADSDRLRQRAAAENERGRAVVASRVRATEALLDFDPGPWSEYQVELARHQQQLAD